MGHVYILRNSAMPGIVKIGATTREYLSERIAEYHLPGAIEVVWTKRVNQEFLIERAICAALEQHRIDGKREWFNVKPEYAIAIAEGAIAMEARLEAEEAMHRAPATLIATDMIEVGQFIRNERKRQGLTQDQLSAVSNTGLRFIAELEAGKDTAQIGKVISVLSALGNKIVLTQNSR